MKGSEATQRSERAGLPRRALLIAVATSSVLSGCALLDKKPPPTEIEIVPASAGSRIDLIVVASPLVNPSPDGQPSPVATRLYLLNGETAFANASFRDLWENDAATLGPTLLGRTELFLEPGTVQRVRADLAEGTTIVAMVAGFRQFENAKWRAMVGVQGETRLSLKADLKTLSIEMGPQ